MTWKPDYTTLANAKSFLRIADTVDDVQIAMYITSASRAVDTFCGRQFGVVLAEETREYEGKWDPRLLKTVYEIDDVMDTENLSVVLSDSATVLTDYELWPLNAPQKGRPYTQLRVPSYVGRVVVDALWGWTAVPTEAANATLMQVSRLAARRDSPFGVAGSPSDGSEMRLLAKLDPDVMVLLDSVRRKWYAA